MKIFCMVLLGLTTLAATTVVEGGPIPTGPVYTNKVRFRIPFRYDPAEMQSLGAKEIRLYVSRDRGGSWQQIQQVTLQSVSPEIGKFNFQAPSDGEYWFIVRTVDSKGRLHPEGEPMEPGLQVIVDTSLPTLRLELRQPAPGRAQLVWNATDEHLDPTQLKLEYIQPGISNWQTVTVVPKAAGETEWSVPQGGIVAVRGSISDLARNISQDQTQVQIAPAGQMVPRPATPDSRQPIAYPGHRNGGNLAMTLPDQFPGNGLSPGAPAGVPAGGSQAHAGFAPVRSADAATNVIGGAPHAARNSFISHQPAATASDAAVDGQESTQQSTVHRARVVNSRQFQIGYQLQDVGPSGVSSVDLYITQDDGATWYKYGEDNDNQSPIQVEVPREGTYGFAIGARSGVGLASDPPQPGDKPDNIVTVDLTPPKLELMPVQQGRGRTVNKILLQWHFADDNAAEKPISLSFSATPQGPWQPITGWCENTGSYVWTIGPGVPSRFYLRLEGRDLAGNVQAVETPQPVLVDLSRPTAKIIDIEAGPGGSGPQ